MTSVVEKLLKVGLTEYEAKLSTTFSTADEGVEEIKKMIGKSRLIRISSIPMTLLDDLKPLLANKDLKIILPLGDTHRSGRTFILAA